MNPPLEDQFNDVLGKAQRGKGMATEQLARAAGVSAAQVEAVLGGTFDEPVVSALARALELAPERLVALGRGEYSPDAVEIDGLRQFTTAFDDMLVNAYLVWDAETRNAAVFDTGSDVDDLLREAARLSVRITEIFITHSHGDHVYDLDRLREKTGAPAWTPHGEEVNGTESFRVGKRFSIGRHEVETRLTCGHARGGVTYVVHGLAKPVAICGDALFAGSMGGGMISYAQALQTNRESIFSLPDETIVAPGHGPLTTVGEERRHNPFFPEL